MSYPWSSSPIMRFGWTLLSVECNEDWTSPKFREVRYVVKSVGKTARPDPKSSDGYYGPKQRLGSGPDQLTAIGRSLDNLSKVPEFARQLVASDLSRMEIYYTDEY